MHRPPQFIAESALLSAAYELARAAHHGPAREGDTDIDHPTAVAEVLHQNGFDQDVVAAALLHDVVEDTALDVDEIERRFGADIGRLVGEMTEDERIDPYPARKAEHRDRVGKDRRVAAIYAADKLASTRALSSPDQVPEEQLQHYLDTLQMLCERHPDLPFLGQLRTELRGLSDGSSASG